MILVLLQLFGFFSLAWGEENFISIPQDCMATKITPCTLGSDETALPFLQKFTYVVFDPKSTAEIKKNKSLRIISGSLWIKSKKVDVESPFGIVQCRKCTMHVKSIAGARDSLAGRLAVQVLQGHVTIVNPQKPGLELPLSSGFEMWVSGANGQKDWDYGIPRPFPFETVLQEFGDLPKTVANGLTLNFKKLPLSWNQALDESREFNKNVIDP